MLILSGYCLINKRDFGNIESFEEKEWQYGYYL